MQEEWVAGYEKLREELGADETICFMDGVHPTHNVQPAYGWIKKEVRKEIPANTGRARLKCPSLDRLKNLRALQIRQTLFFQKLVKGIERRFLFPQLCRRDRCVQQNSPIIDPAIHMQEIV